MTKKKEWSGAWTFPVLLILILDSKTALQGIQTGIDLCLKTVIPSLFPFILLSIVLVNTDTPAFLKPFLRLLGMPQGSGSILIAGFLGGYPVGARSVAEAWKQGELEKGNAERLLGFCCNAGPAFLFGMSASLFPKLWMPWALWGIHITSAFLTSLLIPGHCGSFSEKHHSKGISLPEALNLALHTMTAICGWVILFRCCIAFLNRWILWLLPKAVQISLIGALELTNGCCELACISSDSLRFILCSGMLSWGGLCVAMQTVSVTEGLSLRWYFLGKGLQTMFSLLLSAAVTTGIGLPCCLALLSTAALLRKKQKNSSIPASVGV